MLELRPRLPFALLRGEPWSGTGEIPALTANHRSKVSWHWRAHSAFASRAGLCRSMQRKLPALRYGLDLAVRNAIIRELGLPELDV